MFWMISNRALSNSGNPSVANLGDERGAVTYWMTQGPPDKPEAWKATEQGYFQDMLKKLAGDFPGNDAGINFEDQKHITLFVHGYNNTWQEEATRYGTLCKALFSGAASMGECVMFDWPSNGKFYDYLPDRKNAQDCAGDLADVLSDLYDWLLGRQQAAQKDRSQACRAKTSVIAHSMGNFLLQKAMATVWTRKNQPLLVSLINQLIMVAADVDNDLFGSGEAVRQTDGDAVANLTYRATALYSGLDPVLGMSAGLKHFGKRRLGRSGLDHDYPVPDNVWDVDCSRFFNANTVKGYPMAVHGAYFDVSQTQQLMGQLLRGIDRTVLVSTGHAPEPLAKPQRV